MATGRKAAPCARRPVACTMTVQYPCLVGVFLASSLRLSIFPPLLPFPSIPSFAWPIPRLHGLRAPRGRDRPAPAPPGEGGGTKKPQNEPLGSTGNKENRLSCLQRPKIFRPAPHKCPVGLSPLPAPCLPSRAAGQSRGGPQILAGGKNESSTSLAWVSDFGLPRPPFDW